MKKYLNIDGMTLYHMIDEMNCSEYKHSELEQKTVQYIWTELNHQYGIYNIDNINTDDEYIIRFVDIDIYRYTIKWIMQFHYGNLTNVGKLFEY